MGRFISKALGFRSGDPNLYEYMFNNPANYRDPNRMRSTMRHALCVLAPIAVTPEFIFGFCYSLSPTYLRAIPCESIANQFIVLLYTNVKNLAANHAPEFLLTSVRTPILKCPISVSWESVHQPKGIRVGTRCSDARPQ
jgi:hypothetical protein